jgi:hypothetical protein
MLSFFLEFFDANLRVMRFCERGSTGHGSQVWYGKYAYSVYDVHMLCHTCLCTSIYHT